MCANIPPTLSLELAINKDDPLEVDEQKYVPGRIGLSSRDSGMIASYIVGTTLLGAMLKRR
jgi:hypothetical protein